MRRAPRRPASSRGKQVPPIPSWAIGGIAGATVFGCVRIGTSNTGGAFMYGIVATVYATMAILLWRWAQPSRVRKVGVIAWCMALLSIAAWLICGGIAALTVFSCDFEHRPDACRLQGALAIATAVSAALFLLSAGALLAVLVYSRRRRWQGSFDVRSEDRRPKRPRKRDRAATG
jgi:hypothetical protein